MGPAKIGIILLVESKLLESFAFFSIEHAMPIEARQLTQWDQTSWVCGTREW